MKEAQYAVPPLSVKDIFGARAIPVMPPAQNVEDQTIYFTEEYNPHTHETYMVLCQGTQLFDVEHGGMDSRFLQLNSHQGIGLTEMPDLQQYGDNIQAISERGGFLLYNPYSRQVQTPDEIFYGQDGYLVARVGNTTFPIRQEELAFASHQRSPSYRTLLVSQAQYVAAQNKVTEIKRQQVPQLPYISPPSAEPEQVDPNIQLINSLSAELGCWFQEVYDHGNMMVDGYISGDLTKNFL